MTIRIWLFARYRELADVTALDLEVAPGTTLGALWTMVQRRVPALAQESRPLMAIDQTYAQPDQVVRPGSEVAFFPPVSGG
ncbi:MAG TPA: molybdopterin converting factor subunit 1 [Candidatus Polarisedimenticolia bacterium]|nr:molybdopterin converting factor subunit 1 [Candidatus Polarisedimenticolia bacterium]